MDIFALLFGWVRVLPTPLATALIAMTPSVELSVALPVGVLVFGLPLWLSFVSSVLGSLVPVFFILTCAEPLTNWLQRHSRVAQRFFTWLFHHTRQKFMAKYERYGDVALLLFTAFPLPIPFSGAWTGAIAAWVFGIPSRRAVPLLAMGMMIAGGIMAALVASGSALLSLYLPKP